MRDNDGRRPDWMHDVDDGVRIDFVALRDTTDEMWLRQRAHVHEQNERPASGEQNMRHVTAQNPTDEVGCQARHEALDKPCVREVPTEEVSTQRRSSGGRTQLR